MLNPDAEQLARTVVPYVVLKEIVHGMVCLSESHQGLNFRDLIGARHYSIPFLVILT